MNVYSVPMIMIKIITDVKITAQLYMLLFNLTRQLVWYTNRKKVLNLIKLYFQKGKINISYSP